MPKTAAALVERSLQLCDQVGGGQIASAEDTQFAVDALITLLAELRVRSIAEVYIYPADLASEDIPDELFNPLAECLALELKPTFTGIDVTDEMREDGFKRIRRITTDGPTYETLQVDQF